MNRDDAHPAARFDSHLGPVRWRGNATVIVFAAAIATRMADTAVRLWQDGLVSALRAPGHGGGPNFEHPSLAVLQLSDTLVASSAYTVLALFALSGVVFLMWLHSAVKLTQGLGDRSLLVSPKDAVMAFIIPLMSFIRPYQIMRDLHDALAADLVPEPDVHVRAGDATGYRQVEIHAPPPAMRVPHASIGAWWLFFWIGAIAANIAARQTGTTLDDIVERNITTVVSDAIDIVSLGLAIMMVRAIVGRLSERYRRVRHGSVEALQAAGVVID